MPLNDDVRRLITVLDEEGFGAVAGELMSEISLGRLVEKARQSSDDEETEDELDIVYDRTPIPDVEQWQEAIDFLKRRLVDPVRAFLDAEKMASEIAEGKSTSIRLVDPEEGFEVEQINMKEAGDSSTIDELGSFLTRLRDGLGPSPVRGR